MTSGLLTAERRRMIVVGLIATHVCMLIVVALQLNVAALRGSDAERYVQIARTLKIVGHGAVEYPPLAATAMQLVGGPVRHMALWLVVITAASDVVIAAVLRKVWSARAATLYLALSVPLLPFLALGFDLAVSALVVVALACVELGYQRRAGAILATSVFLKLWPVAVLPILWARGKRTAAAIHAIGVACGIAWWLHSSGIRGISDVVTFRNARGWHVESVPGWFVAVISGHRSRYESGAWRVGAPWSGWSKLMTLGVVLVACWVCSMLRRDPRAPATDLTPTPADQLLLPAVLGVVATIMIGSTLLSPQYVAWVLPLIAIVGSASPRHGNRNWVLIAGTAFVVSTCVYIDTTDLREPDSLAAHAKVFLRNATLVWLAVAAIGYIYSIVRARSAADSTCRDGSTPILTPASAPAATGCNPVNA